MKVLCTRSYQYRNYRIYDNGTGWNIYNGPDKIGHEFNTAEEAEQYIDELSSGGIHKVVSNKLHTYLIHFVTSSDTSSEIEIKATDPNSARKQAMDQLGRECFRIVQMTELDK